MGCWAARGLSRKSADPWRVGVLEQQAVTQLAITFQPSTLHFTLTAFDMTSQHSCHNLSLYLYILQTLQIIAFDTSFSVPGTLIFFDTPPFTLSTLHLSLSHLSLLHLSPGHWLTLSAFTLPPFTVSPSDPSPFILL